MTRQCRRCFLSKPIDSFAKQTKSPDGLFPWCRQCCAEYTKSWRADKAKDPFWKRVSMYRITREQFQDRLIAQDVSCAICRTKFASLTEVHTDHDHACCNTRAMSCGECVRGMLCRDCNTGLGAYHDDIARLQAAIDYLRSWGK